MSSAASTSSPGIQVKWDLASHPKVQSARNSLAPAVLTGYGCWSMVQLALGWMETLSLFHTARYNSFKSLPESLSMEQLGLEENDFPPEVDGPLAEDAGMDESPYGILSLKEETTRVTSQP